MSHIRLITEAAGLQQAWRSSILGKVGAAQIKVLCMNADAYPDESHDFDEALLVLEGQMNLQIHGDVVVVRAGELYMVPAHTPHAVAAGSQGTLVIIDQ